MKVLLFVSALLLISVFSNESGESYERYDLGTGTVRGTLFDYLQHKTADDQINLPSNHVLELGMAGYKKLIQKSLVHKTSIITIIDFSLPSDRERMWVIDIVKGKVLFHCLVAHGRNSGGLYAENFSNVPGSYTSSPGFYLTDDIYYGKHGMSLYLDGLEKGINDKARERAIVMHGADYVSKSFVENYGRLGRSHGCPAIPLGLHKDIIKTIHGGSCLYIHAPNDLYVMHSPILGSLEL